MNKRTFLYIPLLALFVFTSVAFVQHAGRTLPGVIRLIDQNSSVRAPFEYSKTGISVVYPEGEAAGLRTGDFVTAINGRAWAEDGILGEELDKANVGDTVVYTVQRRGENGEIGTVELPVEGKPLSLTLGQTARNLTVEIVFLLLLPALSFLLGFYVCAMRPGDAMAWILLFLLLGIGSVAMEGGPQGSFSRAFQQSALNPLGIWMLLFGVYFPERLAFDRRHPWVKWLLVGPLAVNALLTLIEQTGRYLGLSLWKTVHDFIAPFDNAAALMTMIAMGTFFACLAIKSATLENKDSRRRLRILYVGTSIAMLPALTIVVYRILSGRQGGFFELVPSWFAILALVSMLLFPLTMAYVIVVQRAMDVSVVIRQGLQYGLAKNGVLAIQVLLSFVVILTAASFVSDTAHNRPQKITFIAIGIAFVFLIRLLAVKIRTWVDRRFFREAYDAEQILSDLSDDVRTMVETRPLLETVASKISESLHVPQVALLLKNGSNFVPAYAIGYDTPPVVSLGDDSRSMRKLKSNKHIVLYDDMTEVTSIPVVSLDEREQLTELNTQILLPLAVKDELSGIISLSPKRSEEPYTATDLRLLRSVASQTGLALENSRLTEAIAREAAQKERLNTELEIAREVQERLFPQELPVVKGLDFFGACRSALTVGGDYYDFLELPDGKFGFAIGDISGKGVGASLMMASLQASLRGQTIHFGNDLAGLMSQINGLVYEASTTNRYATFFYAQYDPRTRLLSYVNAGHNPPFLVRANGDVLKLEDGGAVVGMLPPMLVEYEQGEIQLEVGDVLAGFTDGISEAMNPADEEWGEDAMLERLKEVRDHSACEIIPLVVTSADEFANGAKQHDDMTMIVVKVL
jgi:sigma-B regulation protein RsbU (phosphoserine phosphatase)